MKTYQLKMKGKMPPKYFQKHQIPQPFERSMIKWGTKILITIFMLWS